MDIKAMLQAAVAMGVSDIHISVGTPPVFRINGNLIRWAPEGKEPILVTQEESLKVSQTLMTPEQFETWQTKGEIDFSYSIPGLGRFRVNIYRQRGCASLALRFVPYQIPPLASLGVPQVVSTLAEKSHGLVLVTGATGSGKSTTLAALIDKINHERSRHIITLEDPIEYLHQHRKSIVNQREIGNDTYSLAMALRSCLRQDPDVILVGEMLDLETIATAITAAETGHLVFATLYTNSVTQTIERIIDIFPPGQQDQIRVQLANTLQGVVTQQLLPTIDGTGRVLAAEVMVATPAVRTLIREGKIHQMSTVLQTGGRWGMQTMDLALRELVLAGKISLEIALKNSHDPDSFSRMMSSF